MVRAKKFPVAERLLLELIDATEAEARIARMGVAPWYYQQLADLYHARRDVAAELATLMRFREQRETPADLRRPLLTRLKALLVRGTHPRAPGPTASTLGTGRTCALASCHNTLAPRQVKYCCAEHHFAAQRRLRPNSPEPTRSGREEGASGAD